MDAEALRLPTRARRWRRDSSPDRSRRRGTGHPAGLGEDSGPHPVVRAGLGLVLGLAAGAVVTVLTPRPTRSGHADEGQPPGSPA